MAKVRHVVRSTFGALGILFASASEHDAIEIDQADRAQVEPQDVRLQQRLPLWQFVRQVGLVSFAHFYTLAGFVHGAGELMNGMGDGVETINRRHHQ